ncbi:hypothetical protein BDW22DRAFT_1342678 [Trametopsis cervina]|nr:hypothetical protein BDW22DRAFT_1342678 [Trametopsis cervina]
MYQKTNLIEKKSGLKGIEQKERKKKGSLDGMGWDGDGELGWDGVRGERISSRKKVKGIQTERGEAWCGGEMSGGGCACAWGEAGNLDLERREWLCSVSGETTRMYDKDKGEEHSNKEKDKGNGASEAPTPKAKLNSNEIPSAGRRGRGGCEKRKEEGVHTSGDIHQQHHHRPRRLIRRCVIAPRASKLTKNKVKHARNPKSGRSRDATGSRRTGKHQKHHTRMVDGKG